MEINHLLIRPSILFFALIIGTSAAALGQQTSCTSNPSAQSCGLDSTAHILRIAAAILGVVLLIIIIAAFAIYQRNKNRKLTPDD